MKAHAYTLTPAHGGKPVRLVTYPRHSKPGHLHSTFPAYYYPGGGFKLIGRSEAVAVLKRWRVRRQGESLSRSLAWG